MSAVRIPPVLRANVGGAKQVDVSGATVAEVLDGLVAAHPGLRDQLFTPALQPQLLAGDGELNRFVNVYLDGQDVRYLDGVATPVDPRDELVILPAMAGGA